MVMFVLLANPAAHTGTMVLEMEEDIGG